jgi:alcohol dehydrogenase class IV
MARVVVLDPRLLAGCPPSVIAHSGLDALTQAVEAFTSRHATGWSDRLCLEAMRLLAASLDGFHADPAGPLAEPMLQGSFLAGLGLSMARLGVVHGLAHPLGARLHAPHGQVCAACLPLALAFNREAMGDKYRQASLAVGGDLLETVRALSARLGIQSPLAGRTLPDRDAIIAETLASGSTKANPRPVTANDVAWFLDRLEERTP